MSEWTPTTEQVREGYAYDAQAEYMYPTSNYTEGNRRAFDRWLAQHDADLLAPILERIIADLRGEEPDAPQGMVSVEHAEQIVREAFSDD